MSQLAAQKRARLQTILGERAAWASQLMQVKRMHGWVVQVEHLLDGSWAQPGEVLSNATVASRLDAWREQMAKLLTDGTLSELERECLSDFLQVLSNLRPYLVQCYDQKDFPRTNNEMERSIRALKTQYRRISGRKNWNAYRLALWAFCGICGLVGARCGPSPTAGAACCPVGPHSVARVATGDDRRPP